MLSLGVVVLHWGVEFAGEPDVFSRSLVSDRPTPALPTGLIIYLFFRTCVQPKKQNLCLHETPKLR